VRAEKAGSLEFGVDVPLNGLRKKSENPTPRGLKSARRIKNSGLDAGLKASSTRRCSTQGIV
jgi:hypothetical protein